MNLIKENQLATIVIFILLSIGIVIIIISALQGLNKIHIGFAFSIPPLISLSLKRDTEKGTERFYKIDERFFFLLTALFFLLISLSLLSLHSETYTRPLSFFLLIAVSYVIIASQILFFDNGKHVLLVLLEIIIISVVLRASVYFEFSTVYGNDPFFHINGIQLILSKGFLPVELDTYVNFPYFHLIATSTSQITGLSSKNALFLLSIIEILGSLFVFIIASKFVGKKIAFLSMMMITVAPYNIYWGIWLIPMTLGLVFFIIILYLLIKKFLIELNDEIDSKKISFLLIFLCFSSILVHTIAPFITWVTLSFILVGLILYSLIISPFKIEKPLLFEIINFLIIIILYGSLLFSFWMNINKYPNVSLFSLFWDSISTALTKIDTGSVSSITLAPTYNYLTIFLADLPFTLLLFFGIFGSITIIRYYFDKPLYITQEFRKYSPQKNLIEFFSFFQSSNPNKREDLKTFLVNKRILFAMIFTTFLLVGLVYSAGILGIVIISPERWFAFIEILLAIPASYGIFLLIFLRKKLSIQLFVSSFLFFLFVFSAITIPMNNGDNPLYAKELSVRSGLFDSEVKAALFLSSTYNGTISRNEKYQFIQGNTLNPNESESFNETLIILRNYDFEKGFHIPLFGSEGKLLEIVFPSEKFLIYLDNSNKVYENGVVRIYPYFG